MDTFRTKIQNIVNDYVEGRGGLTSKEALVDAICEALDAYILGTPRL